MGKELVISSNRHETKVAILEDDQLVEVYFQRSNEYSLAGSIHKGRVTRVLPGMQSAFVDIGLERDAFLYVSDFFEEHEEYDKMAAPAEERGRRAEKLEPRRSRATAAAAPPARGAGCSRERRGSGRQGPQEPPLPAAAQPGQGIPGFQVRLCRAPARERVPRRPSRRKPSSRFSPASLWPKYRRGRAVASWPSGSRFRAPEEVAGGPGRGRANRSCRGSARGSRRNPNRQNACGVSGARERSAAGRSRPDPDEVADPDAPAVKGRTGGG